MILSTWVKRLWGPGHSLVSPDSYEDYRRIQNEGNARKIDRVFVKQDNIAHLAKYIRDRLGSSPRILCHGSRNGAELRFFKAALPEATLLGTDIGDTATQFLETIQWDFHDMKPEWAGAWDVIYSNSWDHAFDPEKAFTNWVKCLSQNGILVLEHSRLHHAEYTSKLDPFGATVKSLCALLNRIGGNKASVIKVMKDLPERGLGQKFVILGASQANE